LQDIINDPNKRKKLIVYINPPYAEAGSTVKRDAKKGVSNETMVHRNLCANMGAYAKREIFAQFLIRIYLQINGCMLAQFSKLKALQSSYFSDFRKVFQPKLEKMFVCRATTFDNVKGQFPIGFMIWNTSKKEIFESYSADVYNENGNFTGIKTFFSYDEQKFLNDWLRPSWNDTKELIGYLACNSNDFQHQNEVVVQTNKNNETSTFYKPITTNNLLHSCIYFAVRKVIPADWLNDRDQFLYPNNKWENDEEFQNDCLAYTLFSNNIQSKYGTNHWIPFTEYAVGARDNFESNFMTDFIAGKSSAFKNIVSDRTLFYNCSPSDRGDYYPQKTKLKPRKFSNTALNVFNAGKELWRYYHAQPKCNVNASLYDIRDYFQGRNDKGKMNNKSNDETYNELIGNLRAELKALAKKIEPKVYAYGFLRE